jgi:hypothetical protein
MIETVAPIAPFENSVILRQILDLLKPYRNQSDMFERYYEILEKKNLKVGKNE